MTIIVANVLIGKRRKKNEKEKEKEEIGKRDIK